MNKTNLYDIQSSCGASFEEFSGWMMPKSYGNVLEEYSAVRNHAGILDLSHHGKISLSGKEHLKFLQGILSNDVNKLEEGKGQYSTFLTPKGKMIADMKLYRKHSSVLLELEPGLNESVTGLFIKNRISYKVDIDDLTRSLSLISVQGPESARLIEKTLGKKIPDLDEYGLFRSELDGRDLLIARVNRTGEEGLDIFVSSDGTNKTLWKNLVASGREFDARPVGILALETLRIEAGIPRYGADMNENTIPIEAGLWNALSFEKGCYVGQEVIARIKWRGHVNWHISGLVVEGDDLPKKGSKILIGEREIGHVTSSTFSPALNKTIALGYVRREYHKPGIKVTINAESAEPVLAETSQTPFYNKPESG